MFWVVQTDLHTDNRRTDLLAALERYGIPHAGTALDADGNLSYAVPTSGPVVTNGSVMLSRLARERGWTPGAFLNDNFSYGVWHGHYGARLLNHDAVFSTIGEAQPDPGMSQVFVRPLLDDKTFDGRVMTHAEFVEWQASIVAGWGRRLMASTRIIMARPKPVGQEHRHYIVDGEVVTSSRYKLGGLPNQGGVVDDAILRFARETAAVWQPARAFVLDTCVSSDDIAVVELGCIGNAGLYNADVRKLVAAVDSMQGYASS